MRTQMLIHQRNVCSQGLWVTILGITTRMIPRPSAPPAKPMNNCPATASASRKTLERLVIPSRAACNAARRARCRFMLSHAHHAASSPQASCEESEHDHCHVAQMIITV